MIDVLLLHAHAVKQVLDLLPAWLTSTLGHVVVALELEGTEMLRIVEADAFRVIGTSKPDSKRP